MISGGRKILKMKNVTIEFTVSEIESLLLVLRKATHYPDNLQDIFLGDRRKIKDCQAAQKKLLKAKNR